MATAYPPNATMRRFTSPNVAQVVRVRKRRSIGRYVAVGLIAGGAALQHLLATLPTEPQPIPLAVTVATLANNQYSVVKLTAPVGHHTVRQPAAAPQIQVAAYHSSKVAQVAATAVPHKVQVIVQHNQLPAAVSHAARQLSPLLPAPGTAGDLQRRAFGVNVTGELLHLPSISVAAIRQALSANGSPILNEQFADGKDAAEYIWDAGRVLGIDPAVLMGIFKHESQYGTLGVAVHTHSVGNIRPLAGQPDWHGYRLYASWQQGIDDCYRLLRQYALHGATTVDQAIPVWAPPTDSNDDTSYISSVMATMSYLNAAS